MVPKRYRAETGLLEDNMLMLDEEKAKKLEFNMVEVKHIQPDALKYSVSLVIEGIKYGISGELDQDAGVISIEIPPLSEFVKADVPEGQHDIMLEVVGISKKFYDVPWTDKFTVKVKPGVAASLAESVDVEEELPEVIATLYEDVDVEEETTISESIDPESEEKLEKLGQQVELPKWFTQK